eukprot:IDg3104t1
MSVLAEWRLAVGCISWCELARDLIKTPVLCEQRALGIAAKWQAYAGSECMCQDRQSFLILFAGTELDDRLRTVPVGAKRRPDTYCKPIMSGAPIDRLAISNLSSFYDICGDIQLRYTAANNAVPYRVALNHSVPLGMILLCCAY